MSESVKPGIDIRRPRRENVAQRASGILGVIALCTGLLSSSQASSAQPRLNPELGIAAPGNSLPGVSCVTTDLRPVEGTPNAYDILVTVLTDPGIDRSKLGIVLGKPAEGAFALDAAIPFHGTTDSSITPVVVDMNGPLDNVRCPTAIAPNP